MNPTIDAIEGGMSVCVNGAKFPSKQQEPKVVMLWSSTSNQMTETIAMEKLFLKKDIRVDSLDIAKKANAKYLAMFGGGPKNTYPQAFYFEDDDGDFMGTLQEIQQLIGDGEFDEAFEECVGRSKVTEGEDEFYFDAASTFERFESEEFKKKNLSRYTSDELAAYMVAQSFNDLTRNMIKYNVSGKDLKRINHPKQLMELLHIDRPTADDFMQIIEEEKEKEIALRSNKTMPATSDKWMSKPMTKWTTRETKGWVKSFIKDTKELDIVFAAFDKCHFNGRQVLRYDDVGQLCDACGIDEDSGILEKIIAAASIQMDKEMDDDEKVEEKVKEKDFRVRDFRKFDFIRMSKEPDCIMKYDDDDGIPRAAMPCGHAMASETMFYFICQTFADNYTVSDIVCPVPTCQRKWDWAFCVMVADMDDEEKAIYNKIRMKRIYTDLTECPNKKCGKMVQRPKNTTEMRVSCVCSSAQFCFHCGLPWKKADSKTVCGNASCKVVQDLNTALRKSTMQIVKDYNATDYGTKGQEWTNLNNRADGQEVPKIRACPRCLTLVVHKMSCKWMMCNGCKKSFCFVCLSLCDENNQMRCKTMDGQDTSSHVTVCPVAPIQQFG